MRKRYFYIAGVAASALALGLLGMPASGSVSGRPTPSMLNVIHQPVINKKLVQTKAPNGLPLFTSGNWAGYIALTGGTTTSYKEVQSDYTVPSLNCNSVGSGDGFAYHPLVREFLVERLHAEWPEAEWRIPFFGGGAPFWDITRDVGQVWINDKDKAIANLWTSVLR